MYVIIRSKAHKKQSKVKIYRTIVRRTAYLRLNPIIMIKYFTITDPFGALLYKVESASIIVNGEAVEVLQISPVCPFDWPHDLPDM